AELRAAFLCAEFGFDGDLRHAGYIATWIDLLRADKRGSKRRRRRFGTPEHPLNEHCIWRHSKNHLSAVQRAALLTAIQPTDIDLDKLKVSEGQSLLASLLAQRARLQQHVELAVELGAPAIAIAGEGRITANLE